MDFVNFSIESANIALTKAHHRKYTIDQLIAGVAANDEAVLNYIYDRHFPEVEVFVCNNSGNTEDAHDILQEALVTLWLNVRNQNYPEQGSLPLTDYIIKIAESKWLDRLHLHSYGNTFQPDDAELRGTGVGAKSIADELEMLMLERLYNSLGEKCRQILNKFYYKRKRIDEIASEMQHNSETLQTVKFNCMQRLRSMYLNKNLPVKSVHKING